MIAKIKIKNEKRTRKWLKNAEFLVKNLKIKNVYEMFMK